MRGFGASVRLDGNGITMGIGPSRLVLDPSSMTLDAISLDLAAQQSLDLVGGSLLRMSSGSMRLLGDEVHLGACDGPPVARYGDSTITYGMGGPGEITSGSETVFAC
jgi:hypothetical protein